MSSRLYATHILMQRKALLIKPPNFIPIICGFVDVCGVLTEQPTHERARNYWKVLKNRLVKEGSEVVTKCNRLKMVAEDGKARYTDAANMSVMFREIESIPSKKAEPIKVWIAGVASERVNQMIDPERSIDQAVSICAHNRSVIVSDRQIYA